MQWSAKLESVKRISRVCLVLLRRGSQSGIDNAFTTCCIIQHNIQFEHDGYVDRKHTHLPGGLEEKLALRFRNQSWNGLEGMWVRDNDDEDEDDDSNYVHDPNMHLGRVHSISDKAILARPWKAASIGALIDHHQFGGHL